MLAIIKTLSREFRRCSTVEQIILFGSRARGDNDPRSDIDLEIFCPKASRTEWLKLLNLAEEAKTLYLGFSEKVRLKIYRK